MGQTVAMGRERIFNVRLSDEEWQRVEILCEQTGLNPANLFRMVIKEKFDALAEARSKLAQVRDLEAPAADVTRSRKRTPAKR